MTKSLRQLLRDCDDLREGRFIFVGGAPRTGTTLLQAALCMSPSANPLIPECTPIRRIVQAFQETRAHNQRFPGIYFEDDRQVVTFFGRMVLARLNDTRRRLGCSRLILKEPMLTPQFPLLAELLGARAAYVIVWRDPVDTVASLISWGQRMKAAGREHHFATATAKALAKHIVGFYPQVWPDGTGVRLICVRYERLVQEPLLEISRLCDAIGLVRPSIVGDNLWSGSMLNVETSGPMGPGRSDAWGQPITTSRIGSGALILTAAQQAAVRKRTRKLSSLFSEF